VVGDTGPRGDVTIGDGRVSQPHRRGGRRARLLTFQMFMCKHE
jgi:hypothetical protein